MIYDKEKIREEFIKKNPLYRPEKTKEVYTPEKLRRYWKKARENLKKNRFQVWKARKSFENAVTSGKLIRLPCEKCGALKSEGHHSDYSKPLEVFWLCRKHHRELHEELFLETKNGIIKYKP